MTKHDSIEQLLSSSQSNQALQASALVGRKVWVKGKNLQLEWDNRPSFAAEVSSTYTQITAYIYSALGDLVKTITCHQPSSGRFQLDWDGSNQENARLAPGVYNVEVQAMMEGRLLTLDTLILANINSVSLSKEVAGLRLHVAGQGLFSFEDVFL